MTDATKPSTDPSRRKTRIRGAVVFAVGIAAVFLMMANEGQLSHGPLFGLIALLVALFGLLELVGVGGDVREGETILPSSSLGWSKRDDEPEWMAPKLTAPLAIFVVAVGALLGGYPALPISITGGLLVLFLSAIRRPPLLVFVLGAGIFLPMLGAYGLWDPWETHYGEVAREILARDDWISLWWAQEDWFWSKPILIFWTEALAMGALGVDFRPDANPAHPEWAIRLPIFLMTMSALMAAYFAIARVFGKRAGVVAAVVLATMPHFFFLGHQSITDMPFVSTMVVAMSMLILALAEDPEREVARYRVGPFVISAQHLVFALLFVAAAPQALYLASRNLTLVEGFKFSWHLDRFMFGSGGNGGVPGNSAIRQEEPFLNGLLAQPMAQGIFWAIGLATLLWIVKKRRNAQTLYLIAFYFFCGLSFMGKGIPGFALPGLVALLYLIASRRWSLLFEGRLHFALGALTVAVTGFPWFLAMYFRHGPAFTDRLLIHDHLNRLAAGVHGDTGSVQYFIWQLGYALFPWVGLVPAALTAWLFVRFGPGGRTSQALLGPEATEEERAAYHRRETVTFIALWFTAAFTLFSAMVTKFHHYIFPAVPPAALLVGLLVERMLGEDLSRATQGAREASAAERKRKLAALLAYIVPVGAVLVLAALRGDVRGVIPEGQPERWREGWRAAEIFATNILGREPNVTGEGAAEWLAHAQTMTWIAVVGTVAVLAAAYWTWRTWRRTEAAAPATTAPATTASEAIGQDVMTNEGGAPPKASLEVKVESSSSLNPFEKISLGAALVTATVVCAFVGRDLSWVTDAKPAGYERLIHLFIYNYGRPWPEQFDFRPVLGAFVIVATGLFALAVVRSIRPLAMRGLLSVAFFFAVWCLDIYIVDLSPHWGQRETVKRYYEERASAEEPLVAWQMNWKGENFYSGNRVSVFADLDNKKIKDWLEQNKDKRIFFMLEHSRVGSLRSLLTGRSLELVTTERDNNKFLLAVSPPP